MAPDARSFAIEKLGEATLESPVKKLTDDDEHDIYFVDDAEKVLFDPFLHRDRPAGWGSHDEAPALELAGPREKIYFDPANTVAAIVTCGGLCPGINDVVRALVMGLYYRYGVKNILGIRHGYQGFVKRYGWTPIRLDPDYVNQIHYTGGTVLGTSRGEQKPEEIVDFLEENRINVLFTIGGDGTLKGALAIARETEKRGLKISVVGIPKTVDNDIMYIDNSFGFETAFSEAAKFILNAHNEAKASPNGIGIVKLMGRNSGFIACFAALGMTDVNFVLIPEVPFRLSGEKGFLNALKKRIEHRGHAVIVVAEGAGQDLMGPDTGEKDASGNTKFRDIGVFLSNEIKKYFREMNVEVNIKYIDPSYIIRSIPATAYDAVFCVRLAQGAVHAAMSGRTRLVVGSRLNQIAHFPMELIASGRKKINPEGSWWQSVLSATGQPVRFY